MLKHVSFVTADTDAVIRFYTELGASVGKDLVTAEGFRRLVLTFGGGGKLQFFEVIGTAAQHPADTAELLPARPHHAWMEHIALYLPDLNASVARLKAQGVTFARELTLSPSGNPMAFVIDPDGRQVELLEG